MVKYLAPDAEHYLTHDKWIPKTNVHAKKMQMAQNWTAQTSSPAQIWRGKYPFRIRLDLLMISPKWYAFQMDFPPSNLYCLFVNWHLALSSMLWFKDYRNTLLLMIIKQQRFVTIERIEHVLWVIVKIHPYFFLGY